MTDEELYEIYNRIVGKVRSGTKLQNTDFGVSSYDGFRQYPEDGRTAVTIAADDVAYKAPTKTKKELLAEIKRRLDG